MMEELTVLHLQDSLCKEIETILQDMLFQNPLGQEVHLRAFPQELPIERIEGKNQEEEDTTDPFPYCIVRVEDGDIGEKNIVDVSLIFGVFYDNSDRQGHARIMTMIHRIYHRFAVNPVLDSKYVWEREIKWAMEGTGENRHPYYFGGMSFPWRVPKIEREDEFT